MFDRNMLAKIDFMLDDGTAKSTFVIFSWHMNGFMVDFVSVSICVGGITQLAKNPAVGHYNALRMQISCKISFIVILTLLFTQKATLKRPLGTISNID